MQHGDEAVGRRVRAVTDTWHTTLQPHLMQTTTPPTTYSCSVPPMPRIWAIRSQVPGAASEGANAAVVGGTSNDRSTLRVKGVKGVEMGQAGCF